MFDGIEPQEFAKTLNSAAGGACQWPVAFVRERPALWCNSLDETMLAPFLTAHRNRTIVTLGNSMGGFAAILFGGLLPGVRRSISFCPQFSVHPAHCPWESRWREQTREIDHWRFETCLPGPAPDAALPLDHVVFCGADVPDDVRHAEMILNHASGRAAAFVVDGCGHDVARTLKRQGVLVPLLGLLIDKLAAPVEIATFLRQQGILFDRLSLGHHPGDAAVAGES